VSPIDHDCTPQERNVLLARIAELEAENKRWKEWHSRWIDDYRELRLLRARAEEAKP